MNKLEIENRFNTWDWNEGKIGTLPNLTDSIYGYLKLYFKDENLMADEKIDKDMAQSIQDNMMKAFDNIVKNFHTKQDVVELYGYTYTLNANCKQFFLENSKDEVFYIRANSIIGMFNLIVSMLNDKLFADSILIKEMSGEESNKYFDLLVDDENKADEYRSQFYTSFSQSSSSEVINISNKLIIESLVDTFKSKIIKENYNGNEQLNSSKILFDIIDLNNI